ncbi:endo-1,4-beta-glucanase [Podospora conica]|nr:endo-1,4-beta-glucanase [Schizothecium conicum]
MTRLTLLLAAATTALAHSHLAHILINGALYHGFDPRPNKSNSPDRVAWSTGNPDDGYVPSTSYTDPSIACHIAGNSTPAHAPVRPGDVIHVQWNGWPRDHQAPLLSYLAPCTNTPDGCASASAASLRWTKIDDSSPVVVDQRAGAPGTWSSHVMIARNNSWGVRVPRGTPGGAYVLRHEAIALHFAKDKGKAQNYPLCVNLWVDADNGGTTGGQRVAPLDLSGGVPGTELYTPEHPGILIDVFKVLTTTYAVPGPTMARGAEPVPHAEQTISVSRTEGVPVRVVGTRTVPWTGSTARAFSR